MANRTVREAQTVHGTNPQFLIEKIIRSRIYDSRYWKEECFALTGELLAEKALALKYIGGVYGGNVKPTPFLCLTLKMLQIQPERDIVIEFIKNEECKYVRALGVFYLRLTAASKDIFKYLEPLLNDYRKLKKLNRQGQFELICMDEFIDALLRDERVCDIQLPRLQKRSVLEANNQLEPRVSFLEDGDGGGKDEEDDDGMISSDSSSSQPIPVPALEDEKPKQRPKMFKHRRTPSPRHRYEDVRIDRIEDKRERRKRQTSSSSSEDDRRRQRRKNRSRSRSRHKRKSSCERHRRKKHRHHHHRRNKRSSS